MAVRVTTDILEVLAQPPSKVRVTTDILEVLCSLNVACVFDPTSMSSDVVLSNNNLTFTNTAHTNSPSSAKGIAAAAIPKKGVKVYFEISLDDIGTTIGSNTVIGVIDSSNAPTGTATFSQGAGFLEIDTGNIYNCNSSVGSLNDTPVGSIPAPANGNVIGIAIDTTPSSPTMEFTNVSTGQSSGVLALTLGASNLFVPVVTVGGAGTQQFTLNMGATAFAGHAPSGFTSWNDFSGTTVTVSSPSPTSPAPSPSPSPSPAPSGPPTGVMAATESPDTFGSYSGIDNLFIEHTLPQATVGLGSFSFTSDGPDRIVVVFFGRVSSAFADQNAQITGISDNSVEQPKWTIEDTLLVGPDDQSRNYCSQIAWAHFHNQQTNCQVSVDWSTNFGGAGLLAAIVVRGINGTYNQPWDTNPSSFGAYFGGMSGANVDVKSPVPLQTGSGLGDPPATLTLALFGASADSNNEFGSFGTLPGFTVLQTEVAIPHGLGAAAAGGVQSYLSPVGIPISPEFDLDTGNNTVYWTFLYNTLLQAAPCPGAMHATESPDSMAAHGFVGFFNGPVGSWESTEATDTFAAQGFQPVSAVWESTEAQDKFAAFVFQPLTGTLTATEATDVFSATGIGLGEDGVLMTTEAPDVFSATGTTPVSGTFVTTEAPDKFSATGAGVTTQRKRRVFFVT